MVTREEFSAYEYVRESGLTNMFAVNVVMDLSGLKRETILDIMENYGEYRDKYISNEEPEEQ